MRDVRQKRGIKSRNNHQQKVSIRRKGALVRFKRVGTAIQIALLTSVLSSCCATGDRNAGSAVGGSPPPKSCSLSSTTNGGGYTQTQLQQVLDVRRSAYSNALGKAKAWLDRLNVDPFAVRAAGGKGKKALTAFVDVYLTLYRAAAPDQRPAILNRMRRITAITEDPRFHDMATVSDQQFKQDATSYLRLAYLMEQAGLNTALYRQQIAMIEPRLNRHISSRGVHQRMAFAWYYEYFGLQEPFPLGDAFRHGLIAGRRDWRSMSYMDAYQLTHEVFVPYQYGEIRDSNFFTSEDKAYLRNALEALIELYMEKDDPDLTAELATCVSYLGIQDIPSFTGAIAYLISSQNADGSWGSYELLRERCGPVIDSDLYLHTVLVAIDALVAAFDSPPIQPYTHKD
jgi:hypothetical protein